MGLTLLHFTCASLKLLLSFALKSQASSDSICCYKSSDKGFPLIYMIFRASLYNNYSFAGFEFDDDNNMNNNTYIM